MVRSVTWQSYLYRNEYVISKFRVARQVKVIWWNRFKLLGWIRFFYSLFFLYECTDRNMIRCTQQNHEKRLRDKIGKHLSLIAKKNTINSPPPPPPFSLIFLSIMTVWLTIFLYGRFVCDVFGCYPFLFLCCKVYRKLVWNKTFQNISFLFQSMMKCK